MKLRTSLIAQPLDEQNGLKKLGTTQKDMPTSETTKKPAEKNIHKDHRGRLKNQYMNNGIESLTDVQKLELLLFYVIPQKDTNPIAHALLDEFGSIRDVLQAEPRSLSKVKGVKDSTITFLKLVHDINNLRIKPSKNEIIDSSAKAKAFASDLFSGASNEQFFVICLAKNGIIKKVQLMDTGTSDEVNVQIRNITELALDCRCNRIIIAHNHPNGFGEMSDEDFAFTYALLCSCLLNSIEILDHIVVGMDKPFSFYESGKLEQLRKVAVEKIHLPKDKILFLSNLTANYINSKDYDLK